MIRPAWQTITSKVVLAAVGGVCAHGREAAPLDPIVPLGARHVVEEPDGRRHVDVSGVEWHPEECRREVPS